MDRLWGQGAERVRDHYRLDRLGAQRLAVQRHVADERVSHDQRGRASAPLQLDGIVQTARCAGPSIADGRQRHVVVGADPGEQRI